MHGLAEGLDPDSAYLTADQVKQVESGAPLAPGGVGLELTRQYYLRVIAARDNSPAAKAGLRTGDYIRAINEMPTREMSVWEGVRALRGTPGSKVSVTDHPRQRRRPARHRADAREPSRPRSSAGAWPAPASATCASPPSARPPPSQVAVADRRAHQGRRVEAHRRRAPRLERHDRSRASRSRGCSSARARSTIREQKGGARETIAAASGDGAVTLPMVVLIDTGTSAAAEIFAAALAGNKRADLIGEHTIGRAASQKLVKLPDGAGLWLSTMRYLTPTGAQLHEKGLEPTVAVDDPEVEFGQPPPTADPILDKALERLSEKKAA